MYKPPFYTSAFDTDELGSKVIQPMPVTRIRVEASKNWYEEVGDNRDAVTQNIINENSGLIQQFFIAQMQNYAAGVANVQNTEQRYPQVKLAISVVQRQAILDITVYPENSKSGTTSAYVDLNFDGYVGICITQPNYPDAISVGGVPKTAIPGPWDIYMNGYLIYGAWQPASASDIFLIMFGETALRSPSLMDPPTKDAPNYNTLVQTPGFSRYTITPSSGVKIADRVGLDGHTDVPEHPDEPGYFVFNWVDPRNPLAFPAIGYNVYMYWDNYFNDPIVRPRIVQGVQFQKTANSPVNPKGMNYVTVLLTPGGRIEEVVQQQQIIAEFYDRSKARNVSQSWKYGPDNALDIAINDSPLLYGTGQQGVDIQESDLGFDLDPKLARDPTADGFDNNYMGYTGTPSRGTTEGSGLTDAQREALVSYQSAVQAALTAFQAQQAPLIAAAVATYQQAAAAQTKAFTNKTTAEFQYANSANKSTVLYWYQGAHIGTVSVYEAAGDIIAPLYPFEDYIIQSISAFYSYAEAQYTTALAATQAALDQVAYLENQVPTLPPRPSGGYKSIDAFKYRTVDVIGDAWTFGPWQGADT